MESDGEGSDSGSDDDEVEYSRKMTVENVGSVERLMITACFVFDH